MFLMKCFVPRCLLIVLCFFVLSFSLKAESVFSLNLERDIVISVFAIGLSVGSFFLETPPDHIPNTLNRNDINSLDRSLMVTQRSATIRHISDVTVAGLAFLPLLSIPDYRNGNTLLTYGIMYLQAVLLSQGTENLIKANVTRWRPYLYDDRELRPKDRNDSFPSGHTCSAFLSATFFSTTFAMEYPDSRWKWPAIIGSHSLAAAVGVMRMSAGMHFFTDVLAGAAIGSLYGWLIPYVHRNRNSENDFPIILTGNALLVSLKF